MFLIKKPRLYSRGNINISLISVFFTALLTNAKEIKLVFVDTVTACFFHLYDQRPVIESRYIIDTAADSTLHMAVLADISIIAETVLAGIDDLDQAQFIENLDGLINRSKTHGRIFRLQGTEQHFSTGMLLGISQRFINCQSLRSDFITVLTQQGGQFLVV